jgi:hypothetical protein
MYKFKLHMRKAFIASRSLIFELPSEWPAFQAPRSQICHYLIGQKACHW